MKQLITKIFPLWPFVIYAVIVLVLFKLNYVPGTILTGWDNLHPEYNFALGIKRSLVGVWQEYGGLGFHGGMGYASDLIHQVFLYLLSFVLPRTVLRYSWVFITLFLGASGAYTLIKYVLGKRVLQKTDNLDEQVFDMHETRYINIQLLAFLGGLFYLLNLSTVQVFYVPFEAFIAHFASLPFLLYAGLLYYHTPTRKNLILFSVILLLSTPSGYVPTLYVVYLLALTILLGWELIGSFTMGNIVKLIKVYGLIFLINAFWLLPFLYFVIFESSVTLNSKINQMATETIFSQNKEFGTISNAIQLKGFWFNNVDPNRAGNFSYMLPAWRAWVQNEAVTTILVVLFGIVLLGALAVLYHRRRITTAFFVLFVFCIVSLAVATPPFSWVNSLLRSFPLLHEAFRFPFTKFSILSSLVYALFFVLGIASVTREFARLSDFLKRTRSIKNITLKKLKFTYNQTKHSAPSPTKNVVFTLFVLLFTTVLLFFPVFPAFHGQLFYEKEKLSLPREYTDLFNFFRRQNPHARVANFPQYTFWGWNFYSWGYGGSGFLWHGIKQPILDRAFDVWSKNSENYYLEMSYAIYSKNEAAFMQLLNKYQINWLIVDKNIINPPSPQTLFIPELEALLLKNKNIEKTQTFGKIDVYKVRLSTPPQSFIFTLKQVPRINGYTAGNKDVAYQQNGNYISSAPYDTLYPFRSLFSGKTQKELEFSLHEDKDTLVFSNTFSGDIIGTMLSIPPVGDAENVLPVTLSSKDSGENVIITADIKTPQIYINQKKVWGYTLSGPLFVIKKGASPFPLNLNLNGTIDFIIKNKTGIIGTTFLQTKQDNIFTLSNKEYAVSKEQTIPAALVQSLPIFKSDKIDLRGQLKKKNNISVIVPKVSDNYYGMSFSGNELGRVTNCDRFRSGQYSGRTAGNTLTLFAQNATACASKYIPTLIHEEGYAVFLSTEHILGQALEFWALNEDEKYSPIATYLPTERQKTSSFVIPPLERFGKAYSFHFDNISIGREKTQNNIQRVAIYPVPHDLLARLSISEESTTTAAPGPRVQVTHLNEAAYSLTYTSEQTPYTLVLSQSYSPLWKAYEITDSNWVINSMKTIFPFFSGKEIKKHVKVNNWENGWIVENQIPVPRHRIIIVYLPQYLEYAGFSAIVIFALFLLIKKLYEKNR